jgi:hypothetical protein
MHLDRDHRERVNVGFLAGILTRKDLWSGPVGSVADPKRGTPDRIRVFCYDGAAEIRNTCLGDAVNNIHKYIHLAGVNTTVS